MPADHGPAFALHAAISAVIALAMAILWALTGAGTFWAGWVWIGLAAAVAVHAALRWALPMEPPGVRAVAILGSLSGILFCTHVAVWLMSGGGLFWPLIPALVTGTATAILALVVYRDRLWGDGREQELTERVDELTRTRRGAVEVQAAELRRIERDLHDGAQARLVALSMQLGRAEERLADRPRRPTSCGARGARRAPRSPSCATSPAGSPRRCSPTAASPPRSRRWARAAVPVKVSSELSERPLPVVETAAYFVVAESLTNVAKHAPGASATVSLVQQGREADRAGQRRRAGRRRRRRQRADGPAPPGGGARRDARGGQRARAGHRDPRGAAVRIVIAEDNALLREGLVALVRERGIEVVAVAEDAEGLLRIVNGHKPDLAIVDVRLPPTFTDEGVRAAIELRERHPETGILILSQYVEPVYTAELLATGAAGFGYLLKERVGDVRAFVDAIERVAAGGTALDGEVVTELFRNRDAGDSGALGALTPREREVLALMAEGRTNAAIARELVVTGGAIEKHVSSIFSKLDLPATDDDHRRVLAVLTFLRAG